MELSQVITAFNLYLPNVDGRIIERSGYYLIDLPYRDKEITLGANAMEAISTLCFMKGITL